jgi:hypothetical protein
LRESLINDDFEAGPLKPVEDQCKRLGLALNKVLEQPAGITDGDIRTTVRNCLDAVMELRGHLTVLINIANRLADHPERGRSQLETDWFKRSPKAVAVSRNTAQSLSGLVEIIRLRAHEAGGDANLDTA